ncbi:MAG: outer membrane protein transport protein [Gammaproteobacteria bacterium]
MRADSSVLINTPENFRDTWRYSLGGSFEVNDKWTLRSGVAFDKSPVRDTERTPRLPDNDRRWISFGAQYRYSPSLSLDAAYTHIYISTTHISQDAGDVEANGLVDGGYHSNANMFAVQLNYRFQ